MAKYRVLVHGRGMEVRRWWFLRRRRGFYVTCYVEADGEAAAGEGAVAMLRGEPKLILSALKPPTLEIEEVVEIPSFEGYPYPRTGFVFYDREVAETPTQSPN